MIKLMKLATFFAALTFQSFALAQSLWGTTEYGMSVSQVQSLYPNATAPAEMSTLYGGVKGLLTIPGIEIVNNQFTAIFYFKDEKLVQVTLKRDNYASLSSALPDFKEVTTALRAKYGQEVSSGVERSLSQATANWLSGKTNITLFAHAMGGSNATLSINYQVRIAKDADKL